MWWPGSRYSNLRTILVLVLLCIPIHYSHLLSLPNAHLILGNHGGSTGVKSAKINQEDKLMVVTFVNGIYHSVEEWQRIADYLQDLFDVDVYPFYNPSSGSWMKDATKAGFELVTRPNDLALAKQLAEHLREALLKVGENGRVLHIAHSGGAILTYLAAKHHLTISETNRIDVATFGAGKSITHKYFKGRLCNYYAKNDPLTLIDKRVNKLLKQLGNWNTDLMSIRDHKHNKSFVFLAAVHNHPVTDHSMEGSPYRKALSLEADIFKATMQSLKLAKDKERNLIRQFRKKSANITGLHHFWDSYVFDSSELFVRRVRKASATFTGMHGFFSKKPRPPSSQSSEYVDESGMFQSTPTAVMNNPISSEDVVDKKHSSTTSTPSTMLSDQSKPLPDLAIVYLDQLEFGESV